MKSLLSPIVFFMITVVFAAFGIGQEKELKKADWLIDNSSYQAKVTVLQEPKNHVVLTNGLVTREFLIDSTVCATVGLENKVAEASLLRAVKPEAIVTIDGERFEVGGLTGQPNMAFLRQQWLDQMKPGESAMDCIDFKVSKPTARFDWKQVRHCAPNCQWPPPGVKLSLEFANKKARVFVHYELYDGVPVFCKWIEVENISSKPIMVDRFTSEMLAIVEQESRVEFRKGIPYPAPDSIHVETDFAFGGFNHQNANRHVVHWRDDPEFTTQVNYAKKTPCLLVVEPTKGPAQQVQPGKTFTSCRAFELLYDSSERERRSLSLRKMYRTIAPWVTENPLMHHMKISNPDAVRRAIDDAAEVGFEMIILSFGSGFNMEDDSEAHLKKWRAIGDYAKSKGVEIGAYSLLSSRRIGNGNDIVSPEGQKPTHGNCPALASEWGQAYYKKLYNFFEQTGFTLLEHDGPYPGDIDVTSRLPLQAGEADSRWVQGKIANDFYRWCRGKGIYINAPDYYYLNGSNKCGMGYREVNWSLPRAMQVIHTRQNIFDGTWYKTPSMGWMFVPLSEYHGGGQAATIEPLDEHRDHYEKMMESNLGFGVQACYRGPRLFDTEATKALVKQKVDWFKKYRNILESDLIHGRRADGRNLDWMLHVNPQLEQGPKGMLLVYNPTEKKLTRALNVNLYYTGLTDSAEIREQDGEGLKVQLQRDYSIELSVTVEAGGMNWFVVGSNE